MLPTPRASGQENPESLIKRKGLREAMQHNLTAAVQLMYPTPTKGMHKQDVNDNGEYARRIKSKGNQIMLPAHVKLYPTPQAADWKNMDTAKQKMLSSEVKLYPTPRVSDTEGGVVKNVELNNGSFSRKNKQGTRWGVKLKDAVNYLEENEMYPTPTQDSASERTKKYKQGGTPLSMAVKMFPTPMARDWKDTMNTVPPRVLKGKRNPTLGQEIARQRLKMMPTPKVSDMQTPHMKKNEKGVPHDVAKGNLRGVVLKKNAKATGARLSPSFVEFLMGFPPQWTETEHQD